MKKSIMAAVLWVMVSLPLLSQAQDDPKKKIENVDDLPRYTYAVKGQASELFVDKEAFHEFARAVRADIEEVLRTDIHNLKEE